MGGACPGGRQLHFGDAADGPGTKVYSGARGDRIRISRAKWRLQPVSYGVCGRVAGSDEQRSFCRADGKHVPLSAAPLIVVVCWRRSAPIGALSRSPGTIVVFPRYELKEITSLDVSTDPSVSFLWFKMLDLRINLRSSKREIETTFLHSSTSTHV